MTYLELCQALRNEAGLSGTGPATVVGQTGMYGKVVSWVQEAYSEILDMYPWSFLWTRVSPTLTIGQTVYEGADFTPAITDLGKVYTYRMLDLTSTGTPRIYYRDWQSIDQVSTDGSTGAPRYFTRRPDDSLQFYPEPDDTYEIQFDYQKVAPVLAANSDEPLIPDTTLHKIIVWKALEYYGQHNEDMTSAQYAARQFNNLLSRMVDRYAPAIQTSPVPVDQSPASSTAELV